MPWITKSRICYPKELGELVAFVALSMYRLLLLERYCWRQRPYPTVFVVLNWKRLAIERYNVTGIEAFAKEMEEKKLGKPKVSLQFELTHSGITRLVKAEASVEELYTVEEEVEVDDEDGENNTTAEAGGKDADEAKVEEAGDRKLEDEEAASDSAASDNETSTNETASAAVEGNDTKPEKLPKKKKKTILQEKVSFQSSLSALDSKRSIRLID